MDRIAYRRGARSRTALLLAALSPAAILAPVPAHAQESTDGADEAIEGIVVTATRGNNSTITDTPLAITSFSGDMLEKNYVTSLNDIQSLDPSVNVQNYGAAQTKIILRGIQSDVGATSALYVDESAVLGGQGGNILGDGKPGLRLHDVERVEVLKGPQGTLFGTSSMSGTLRIITRKPDLYDWSGTVSTSASFAKGGNALGEANGTINAPIVEGVAGIRVTGWAEKGGGYIDQQVGNSIFDNMNDRFVRGGRAQLMIKPNDSLSILAQVTHQRISVDGTQAFQEANGPYLNTSPTIELYEDKYTLANLTAEYKLGFGSIIASGSYSRQNVMNAKDSTPTNISFGVNESLSFVPRVWFKDYNGEIRFASDFSGPLQIVTGAYAEHTESTYQTNAIQAPDAIPVCFSYDECRPFVAPGAGNSIYEFGTNTARDIDQYAIYAQADYKLLDTVTATVGVRYFKADIEDTVTNLQTVFPDFVFGIVTVPSITGDSSGTNKHTSYNFSLLWEATPSISLYARAASGFRIGGVNTATSLAEQAGVEFPGTYKPDSLWSYEGGVKGYAFGRALFFDLSAYYVDWRDQQLSASAAGAFSYTINAGRTATKGVELNLTGHPVHGLTLNGSVTYVDAKLKEDLPEDVVEAGTVGFDGDRIPLSPHWSATASAEYEFAVSGDLNAFLGGDVNYHGSSYSTFNRANDFDTYLPAYTLLGAKLGVRADGWEASLFGSNLTNEAPYLGVVPSLDGVRVFTVRPVTAGLRLRVDF